MVQPLRQSLNRMVLDAMQILHQSDQTLDFLTARSIKDAVEQQFNVTYPIQTIIVVLNRFAARGVVNRVTFAGEEVRQRYGYYLCQPEVDVTESKIWGRFKAYADEFFQGNMEKAIDSTHQLVEKRATSLSETIPKPGLASTPNSNEVNTSGLSGGFGRIERTRSTHEVTIN
jgi:Fe2+ or Zn2+ uptake regulation protein